MKPRTLTLLAVAVIAGFLWLNLQMFGVLDATIDRIATQRMAGSFEMRVKNVTYSCYPARRMK